MVSRITGLTYEQAVKQYLFNPIGMSSGSVSMAGLQANKSWARPHSSGRRPWPMVDTYYKVPGAAGVNSNIKDMTLWMGPRVGLVKAEVGMQVNVLPLGGSLALERYDKPL